MAQKQSFISSYRAEITILLNTLDAELARLHSEYDALNYDSQISASDFGANNANDDITAVEFKSGVSTTKAMLTALKTSGCSANLYRLRR